MTSVFNPNGSLNVSWDASDLPSQSSGNNEMSGWMTRCKNLRLNQSGQLITRDGSAKINAAAIDTSIWQIDEMNGIRFTFAGTQIYEDEASIGSGYTSAQWSTVQYNAFNDTTLQLFALNGTDTKRIVSGSVNEWGIAAPTDAPTLGIGSGSGLTGQFNAKYTYVRKVGTAIVAESNPSPAADVAQVLENNSLTVDITQPTDTQVTHIRLYRTQAGGSIYYLDQEIPSQNAYAYGIVHAWEETDVYLAGSAYKFTITDSSRGTENTYSWESTFEDREDEATSTTTSDSTNRRDLLDWEDEDFRYYLKK